MKVLNTILFSAFLLTASIVTAQGVGIRAGVTLATVSGDYYDATSKTGFYVGIYDEIPVVKDVFFIQPEVQYSSERFSTKFADHTIDYITVPVLAKIYVVKLLSFETGPQFGFKINEKTESKSFIPISSDDNYETFNPAWAFGASLNLPFGLGINARFISSFNSVFKDGDYNDEGKNQVFQLGASLKF
jgi:hypothetical protein